VFGNSAIFVIAGTAMDGCPAIPNLTTYMIAFASMNTTVGITSAWYNIPADMRTKDKLKEESASNAMVLNLVQLVFLGVAI